MTGKPKDRIKVSSDGRCLRQRGDELSTGRFGAVEDGKPIPEGAELIMSGPPDHDGWRDVKVLYRHETAPQPEPVEPEFSVGLSGFTTDGPPQVATPAYREGYDRIFGKKQKVGLA